MTSSGRPLSPNRSMPMVAPWASPSRRGSASAWIETNKAADWLRATFTRSFKGHTLVKKEEPAVAPVK